MKIYDFFKKLYKYFIIAMSTVIIIAIVMGSIGFLVEAIPHYFQTKRIIKFQKDYSIYQSSNQLYHDGAVIAVYAQDEQKCLDAEIRWLHRLDDKKELKELINIDKSLYEDCK